MQFVILAIMLASPFVIYHFMTKNYNNNRNYKLGTGIALFSGIFLLWVAIAVGIMGGPDPFEAMCLVIGTLVAFYFRFKPEGMMIALTSTAGTLFLTYVIEFYNGTVSEYWFRELIFTGFLMGLFMTSAWFYKKSLSDSNLQKA